MAELIAYQNGEYKPLDQVTIALNDAGFVYGATVTDQCRTYRQQPFRVFDHIQNFMWSCTHCAITPSWDVGELVDVTNTLLERNVPTRPGAEWTVVWLASPGRIGSFLGQSGGILEAKPEWLAYCFPLPFTRFRSFYRDGVELVVPLNYEPPGNGILPRRAKHRSRLFWWFAEHAVRRDHPNAQALLLDSDGCITETAAANFVLVRRGALVSPKPGRVYHGVSLLVVHGLAQQLGIPFSFNDIRLEDLATADEAILCSTPYGIAPVGNLHGKPLPINGPVFERLLAGWNELVGLDIRAQFLESVA
jgi:branched-subunit amino acid aminotransferase/4-amino-4-deoxychorismate lyase